MRGLALAAGLVLLAVPGLAADREIRGEESWRGGVTVDGVVTVRKGGSLTLEPGTTVRFVRRDLDGDGIGDAELRVEGWLRARGTPVAPVVFTSAQERPAPADWKFVIVDHGQGVEVANAVFEYAFSGVQVHYTRGSFTRIISRFNEDGFRFSTAPVVLTDSLLTENRHGIRFEERGAGASIRRTLITGNEVGVFAVVKAKGLTVFSDNVIEGNRLYNVKLGDLQRDDLPMGGNWWGGLRGDALLATFFDGRREPGLGKVLPDPLLPARPAAGPGPDSTNRGERP